MRELRLNDNCRRRDLCLHETPSESEDVLAASYKHGAPLEHMFSDVRVNYNEPTVLCCTCIAGVSRNMEWKQLI